MQGFGSALKCQKWVLSGINANYFVTYVTMINDF